MGERGSEDAPLEDAPGPPPKLVPELVIVLALSVVAFYVLPLIGAGSLAMVVWIAGPSAVILLRGEDPARFGLGPGKLGRGAWLALAWTVGTAAGALLFVWILRGDGLELHFEGFWGQVGDHVFGIALPEEVFFRGYLQTRFDQLWRPRWKLFGARLGPGWLLANLLFACAHLLTAPHPARLLTFFPGLVFGYLFARTRSVAAPTVYHGMCNVISSVTQLPLG